MFCDHCGRELYPSAIVCPGCGCATPQATARGKITVSPDDKGGILWIFFGAVLASTTFVPLILFFIWKDQYPERSKSIIIGYVIGLIAIPIMVVVVYLVIVLIIIFVLIATTSGSGVYVETVGSGVQSLICYFAYN